MPQPLLGADEPARLPWSPSTRGWKASGWGRSCGSSATWTHTSPMSADQIEKFIAHMDAVARRAEKTHKPGTCGRGWTPGPGTRRWSAPPAAASSSTASPRSGCSRFPADQVILLDEKREYEVRFDDTMKIVNLPAWQVEALAGTGQAGREPALFADALVPAVDTGPAETRRGWTSGSPSCGTSRPCASTPRSTTARCPAKLSEISVPLPDDPFTGKPFRYESTATRPTSAAARRRRGKEPRLQRPLRGDPPEVRTPPWQPADNGLE